LQKEHK